MFISYPKTSRFSALKTGLSEIILTYDMVKKTASAEIQTTMHFDTQ